MNKVLRRGQRLLGLNYCLSGYLMNKVLRLCDESKNPEHQFEWLPDE